jgi:hypothetical protein
MKAYGGGGGGRMAIAPLILNHGTRQRRVVNFTLQPFYHCDRTPVPINRRLIGFINVRNMVKGKPLNRIVKVKLEVSSSRDMTRRCRRGVEV